MVDVLKHGIVLNKTTHGFETYGVLNPAVIRSDNGIQMLYRAVAKGNYSTIGYARFSSPLDLEVRLEVPILFPQFEYETHGLEDPRVVAIEGTYYLTYTAYDGINALGALALSKDLCNFEKQGLIVPAITYKEFSRLAESKGKINEKYFRYNDHGRLLNKQSKPPYVWDKNVIFFPRRIDGKLCFLHRIRPDIQIVSVQELSDLTVEFWQNYFIHLDEHIVLSSRYKHEISYIGGGCPPIETAEGWLLFYHSVHDTIHGYVYSACAALLDLDNPQLLLARLPYALFKPEMNWELNGYVNNVCFPTGTIVEGNTLYIYYGAADEQIACASVGISELLKELNQFKEN